MRLVSDCLVLFRLERAGGIDERSAGREKAQGIGEQRGLAGLEVGEVFGLEAPFDLGISPERSGAGAGRIDQNAIESRRKGEGTRAVQDHEIRRQRLELYQPVKVEIAGG